MGISANISFFPPRCNSILNPDFPQDGPDPKAMLRLLDFCRYLGHGEEVAKEPSTFEVI